MVVSAGEFDSVFAELGSVGQQAIEEARRENLNVYETMPVQMLHAYGLAAFAKHERGCVCFEHVEHGKDRYMALCIPCFGIL